MFFSTLSLIDSPLSLQQFQLQVQPNGQSAIVQVHPGQQQHIQLLQPQGQPVVQHVTGTMSLSLTVTGKVLHYRRHTSTPLVAAEQSESTGDSSMHAAAEPTGADCCLLTTALNHFLPHSTTDYFFIRSLCVS